MITLNHLVRKKADVSAQAFNDFWLGEHANSGLNLCHKLGVGKYTKCQTMHDDPASQMVQQLYGTATDAYDFVDQMVFGDLNTFKTALQDETVQREIKALHDLSQEYVDFAGSDYWFSVELAQIFPREKVAATPDNTYLKVFYVPRRLDHLSLDQAQLHWNTCHGGMARQFGEFLVYDKYVQGHRKDSSLVWQMKSLLNAEFENLDSIIGQAEAWLDRRVLSTLEGPETELMMRMLLDDILLFVDPGSSHIFGTKEHFILDKQVITEPVPAAFDVD